MTFAPIYGRHGGISKGGLTASVSQWQMDRAAPLPIDFDPVAAVAVAPIPPPPTAYVTLWVGDSADRFAPGDEVQVCMTVWRSAEKEFGFPPQPAVVVEVPNAAAGRPAGRVVVRVDRVRGPDFGCPTADEPVVVGSTL